MARPCSRLALVVAVVLAVASSYLSAAVAHSRTAQGALEDGEAAAVATNDVTINKRLQVNGALKATSMSTKNLTVVGDASVDVLTSGRVVSKLLSSDILETGIIRSPTGTITIDGNLALSGEAASSFMELSSSLSSGHGGWKLVQHDDFEDGTTGWQFTNTSNLRRRDDLRSTCGSAADHFLGGHCKLSTGGAVKEFRGLPKHTKLRVKARAHFLDSWAGEALFAKVEDQVVWADTCRAPALPAAALNVCGAPAPEMKLSAPIDIVIPHSSDSVKIEFSSTLRGDSCEQSWGVDDVMVFAM